VCEWRWRGGEWWRRWKGRRCGGGGWQRLDVLKFYSTVATIMVVVVVGVVVVAAVFVRTVVVGGGVVLPFSSSDHNG
jgi:hypothetical protein